VTKLVHDETIATHTSLKPSTGRIVLPETNKSITISDIPGHPRLKESVQDLVSQANAAVFVVDIATLIRNGPQVAE
jgi:signal recognition particle receptor subunit beta